MAPGAEHTTAAFVRQGRPPTMRVAGEDEMTKLFKLLGPALAVATLAMSSVSAEAADIHCRVPFDFTVKGKALAAGAYTLSHERGVLTVRGEKDGAIVM